MRIQKDLVIVALATFCLTATLFMIKPTRSGYEPGEYNPWVDLDENGEVDIYDAIRLANAFGTSGTPITKAAIEYDSGWIDISDKAGEYFDVTHNINSTDTIVEITGKRTLSGGTHQKSLGGAGFEYLRGRTYGGIDHDFAYALIKTDDGGYALAGQTYSFGAGGTDAYLIKTDSDGVMQWSRTYGGAEYDRANALVQTVDGGYALAGNTGWFSAGGNDAYLVKTDAFGNEMWIKDWFRYGLVWTNSTAEAIMLYRGKDDCDWNYVRVRIWKPKTP